jgi:hypothetical protein
MQSLFGVLLFYCVVGCWVFSGEGSSKDPFIRPCALNQFYFIFYFMVLQLLMAKQMGHFFGLWPLLDRPPYLLSTGLDRPFD